MRNSDVGADATSAAHVSPVEAVLTLLYRLLPLIFAFGFLAPVIATMVRRLALPTAGISPVAIGLIVAGSWGFVAQVRGRWI